MSSTAMDLSACIFLAACTRGSVIRIGRRPPIRPRARAANNPAHVRSWMSLRSNCARDEKMWKINSPEAVVVSMAQSQRDLNPTCRCRSPINHINEVAHRATESVQPPDQQRIPRLQIVQTILQAGSRRLCARDFVRENVFLCTSGLRECIQL